MTTLKHIPPDMMRIAAGLVGVILLLANILGSNELTRAFAVAAVVGAGLIVKKAFVHPNRPRLLMMASSIAVLIAALAITMVPGYLGAFQLGELIGSALGSGAISICAILLIVRAIPNTLFKETQ
jgi:hypothetical protein